jgi:hypothetical protein
VTTVLQAQQEGTGALEAIIFLFGITVSSCETLASRYMKVMKEQKKK